jgi:hypothetical protein
MDHKTACGIRQVLSELDWQAFPQRVGDDYKKNPDELRRLFSRIMNGEVEFSPNHKRGIEQDKRDARNV